MRILICAGHTTTGKGTGANGFINESNENRVLAKKVVEWLKKVGHEVDYYEINQADDYLAKQVAAANSKAYDLVVQIHFNAFKTTNDAMGTETLCYGDAKGMEYAKRINAKLSKLYKSRGAKTNQGLYWIKNTKSTAILIETCFADSKTDTEIYNANKDKTAKLIAEGILNKSISDPVESPAPSGTKWAVCVGAYGIRENADRVLAEAKDKGFKDAYLIPR